MLSHDKKVFGVDRGPSRVTMVGRLHWAKDTCLHPTTFRCFRVIAKGI
jgi:hypothetical protein